MFTSTGLNGGCCNGSGDERGKGENVELHYGGDIGILADIGFFDGF